MIQWVKEGDVPVRPDIEVEDLFPFWALINEHGVVKVNAWVGGGVSEFLMKTHPDGTVYGPFYATGYDDALGKARIKFGASD